MTKIQSVVRGVGGYLPERVISNDELSKTVDTSDEWIVQRTGIRQRHVAAEGEMTSDLALHASRMALERSLRSCPWQISRQTAQSTQNTTT